MFLVGKTATLIVEKITIAKAESMAKNKKEKMTFLLSDSQKNIYLRKENKCFLDSGHSLNNGDKKTISNFQEHKRLVCRYKRNKLWSLKWRCEQITGLRKKKHLVCKRNKNFFSPVTLVRCISKKKKKQISRIQKKTSFYLLWSSNMNSMPHIKTNIHSKQKTF